MTSDFVRILSKLSFKRTFNIFLIGFSYFLMRIFNRPFIWGKPFSISFEPTTSCNLRCPECPSGLRQFSRNTGMLNPELYIKLLDQIGDYLMYIILYFQGEPYLNPSFFEFVKLAKQKEIYTATSTNAHYLSDENARKTVDSGLDRLIISLDGIGQESYSKYRVGGNYEKVVEGIKNVVKWKNEFKSKSPYIIIQFLVLRSNENQVQDVKNLCKELGVDKLQFKTAQIYDYENGSPLIPTIDKYSRYRQKADGRWEIKNKFQNKCFRMWSSCVITWDGLIVPCCFDKDAKHMLGDLKEISFKQIWKSKDYNDFREIVFTNRKEIDICRNCTEGMRL